VTTSAARFARQLLDPDSWKGWDVPPRGNPVHGPYAAALAHASERSGGADESVLTGEGRIDGRRIAVVVGEFDFLAGSIGVAACDRLLRAVHRATAERLPLLACPATGGTRMQEGTPAFVGMVPIVTALAAHKGAGLPYLVHLRHPCTGGVLASWGSVGQLTTAEPGALIGFLGPRVYEALYGKEFPEGVQRAENLHRLGIVDAVLTTDELRTHLRDTLRILSPTPGPTGDPAPPLSGLPGSEVAPGHSTGTGSRSALSGAPGGRGEGPLAEVTRGTGAEGATGPGVSVGAARPQRDRPGSEAVPGHREGSGLACTAAPGGEPAERAERTGAGVGDAGDRMSGATDAASGPHVMEPGGKGEVWRSVTITRAPTRPGVAELLGTAEAVVRLCGTQDGERDDAVAVALARFGEVACVVVGHDRAGARDQGEDVGPGGLRTARRGMRLAAELGLPLVTVIDTAGARLSREAEEGALAGEIARCLQELTTLPVPTLSLLLGQGTGGAALALLPADRVLAAEHAWLAPLPPEGASVILHRTTERAAELADAQRVGAADLLRDGTLDRVIPEPDTAPAFVQTMSAALRAELAALSPLVVADRAQLAQQRGRRGAAFVRLDDEV
jgi:acetyl-CoA carboxylase carboxyl transferase subunit beta